MRISFALIKRNNIILISCFLSLISQTIRRKIKGGKESTGLHEEKFITYLFLLIIIECVVGFTSFLSSLRSTSFHCCSLLIIK